MQKVHFTFTSILMIFSSELYWNFFRPHTTSHATYKVARYPASQALDTYKSNTFAFLCYIKGQDTCANSPANSYLDWATYAHNNGWHDNTHIISYLNPCTCSYYPWKQSMWLVQQSNLSSWKWFRICHTCTHRHN